MADFTKLVLGGLDSRSLLCTANMATTKSRLSTHSQVERDRDRDRDRDRETETERTHQNITSTLLLLALFVLCFLGSAAKRERERKEEGREGKGRGCFDAAHAHTCTHMHTPRVRKGHEAGWCLHQLTAAGRGRDATDGMSSDLTPAYLIQSSMDRYHPRDTTAASCRS